MGRRAILAETGWKSAKISLSCGESAIETRRKPCHRTNLVLTQIIGKVSHHHLGLGWDTILRWAALLLRATTTSLRLAGLGGDGLVGSLSQRISLAGDVGRSLSGGLAILTLALPKTVSKKA